MSLYHSVPSSAAFSRFVQLARSSSRSLSPERELRQMTAHYQEMEEMPMSTNTPEESSGPSGIPASGRTTKASKPKRATGGTTHAAQPSSSTSPFNHNREVMEAAMVWQYGSPLYNPVDQGFYCWQRHSLYVKDFHLYGAVDGVSCDFCGHTRWIDKESLDKDDPIAPLFYHCDECGMDLCFSCSADIQRNERFHVPCMECTHCGVFAYMHDAPLHRCELPSSAAATEPVVEGPPHHTQSATTSTVKVMASRRRPREATPETPAASGWSVEITVRSVGEREELERVAGALGLPMQQSPSSHRRWSMYVFPQPTRLAAERCARQVTASGLKAVVARLV